MANKVKHMGMPHTSIDTNAKSQTRAYYMSAGGQKRWLGPWRDCIEDARHDQSAWTAKHNGETPAPEQDKATARPLGVDIEAVVEPDKTRKLLMVLGDGRRREIGRVPLTVENYNDGDALLHLIVRAVNSHDALVRSCRAMLALADRYYARLPDDGPEQDAIRPQIEAATALLVRSGWAMLALAKVEQP